VSPLDYLNDCRRYYPALPPSEVLSRVDCCGAVDESGVLIDTNADFREQVCELLNRDLQQADRALVRYLLEQEIGVHEPPGWGVGENIKLCAYMLYKLRNIEDCLLIWAAKTTNFDTHCGIEVQLLTGAGLNATINYLEIQGTNEALDAASYLRACEQTGDFNNLEGYAEFAKKYFDERRSWPGHQGS
jgi:hypothetical protein